MCTKKLKKIGVEPEDERKSGWNQFSNSWFSNFSVYGTPIGWRVHLPQGETTKLNLCILCWLDWASHFIYKIKSLSVEFQILCRFSNSEWSAGQTVHWL